MIPFDCVEICDSKYSNLPKYGERSEIQKYFIRKSKTFGNSQAMNNTSQNEQGRNAGSPDVLTQAYSKFLRSEKHECSEIGSPDGSTIGKVSISNKDYRC